MMERIPRWLLVVGIVIAASGCDNVSWGGFDLSLEGPDADSAATSDDADPAETAITPATTLGPLLYAGTRMGNRAQVVPVGEITDQGLEPFPEDPQAGAMTREVIRDRLRAGAELVLFHQGVRIGALVVDEAELVSGDFCEPHVSASGSLLLRPDAAEAQRFVALDRSEGVGYPFDPYRELTSVYDQRVASLNLGMEAIPLVGAAWPASLLDIRQELQILDLAGGEGPAVLATFLHQDQLRIGPAPNPAYALMVLGEPRGSGFSLAYTWYRPVATEGKGAPRYFSRMDWDRDGQDEILLEVLGADSRWYAALDRGPEAWQMIFQDPCGTPGAQGGGG